MKGITPHVAREFCSLCDWAYHANQIHRHLFDDNQFADKLKDSMYGFALSQISIITMEYSLLQIAKLHDRAITFGNITLSIDYMLTYGGWEYPIKDQLIGLSNDLEKFANKLRHVRNKALSHNDLAAVLAGGVLGTFEKDEDVSYFESLQKFASIISMHVNGTSFSYSGYAKLSCLGIIEMMDALKKSIEAQQLAQADAKSS